MANRIPVAVLAATGSVGQRFVQLLDGHPWFEVVALTGSDRSIGWLYGSACNWILPEAMPKWAEEMKILPTDPRAFQTPLVFSALPAEIAREVEPEFAKAGAVVCSNASAHRQDPMVPILLPEVNPEHIGILPIQRKSKGWSGALTTNPNCTSTGMTVTLKALDDAFGVRKVFAVSLQALSGAGYPGVPSIDILDNVVPYVDGEEAKVEQEPLKMLGRFTGSTISHADFSISAHTNRVAVSDGHIVCLSIKLARPPTLDEAKKALAEYKAPEISRNLPSSPQPAILVREENNRPQPRIDRMTGKGMTTVVGRIRPDSLFDLKMVTLSHNTIRGAAGGSIYNAELLAEAGYVSRP